MKIKIVQDKFDFPAEEDLNHLQSHRTTQQIKQKLMMLKKTKDYSSKKIKYSTNQWDAIIQNKKITRYSIYFRCCRNQGRRPALHFTKVREQFVLNRQQSIFQHRHFYHDDEQNKELEVSKPEKEINSQNHRAQRKKQRLIEKRKKKMQILFRQLGKVEPPSQRESFQQSDQSKQQGQLIMDRQIFLFPHTNEIRRLKIFLSQKSMIRTLNNMAKRTNNQIKYRVYTGKEVDKQTGQIIYVKIVKFGCCNFKGKFPFLRYKSSDNIKFTLENYSLSHYQSQYHQFLQQNKKEQNNVNDLGQQNKNQDKDQDSIIATFPLQYQLQSLKILSSIQHIKKAYNKLNLKKHHHKNSIRFQIAASQFVQEERIIKTAIFYFNCCKGLSEKPHISYVSIDGSPYYLQENYSLEHYHEKSRSNQPKKLLVKQKKPIQMLRETPLKDIIKKKYDVLISKYKQTSIAEKKSKRVNEIIIIDDSEDQREEGQISFQYLSSLRFYQQKEGLDKKEPLNIQKKQQSDIFTIDKPNNQSIKGEQKQKVQHLGLNKCNHSENGSNQGFNIAESKLGNDNYTGQTQQFCYQSLQEGQYSEPIQYLRCVYQQSQHSQQ